MACGSQADDRVMADQADVENALVEAVGAAIYPMGLSAESALGVLTRIYRGWPQSVALDEDLASGKINISIFPVPDSIVIKTRFPAEWFSAPTAVRLQVLQSAESATFSGEIDPGVFVGIIVDEATFQYETKMGDSLRSVVESLGNLVRGQREALVLNDTLYVPGAYRMIVRAEAPSVATKEIRRQSERFKISIWCATPESRDQAAALVDLTLAGINFLTLSDGSSARVIARGGETIDRGSDASLFRRDLIYEAEFATTLTQTQLPMLFGSLGVNGQFDRFA